MKMISFSVGSFATNCYIYYKEDTKEALLIDPGAEAENIRTRVDYYGLKPVAILLTHGHFDHIGAVRQVKEMFACPVYAHENEREILGSTGKNLSELFGHACVLEADIYVRNRQELNLAGCSLAVIHTPGHTAGSCCYYDRDADVLFSGDTLFAHSYGRVDFPTGSMAKMQESVEKLLEELPPQTRVFPGHDQPTTIALEREYNPLSPYAGL